MWKDIKNWENLYEVNEYGDVRNKKTQQLIVGDINSAGYYRVCLYCKSHIPSKQRFFRHRLVAEHFISNPLNLPEVNHIDNNKSHNYVSNLEWVTRKENELHSRKFGNKEYKPFKVIFNNNECKIYDTQQELAKDLNVTKTTIRFWLQKKNKGYLKYNIKTIEYI